MMNRSKAGSLVKRLLFLSDYMHVSSYLVRLAVGLFVAYLLIKDRANGNKAILIFIAAYLILGGVVGTANRLLKKMESKETESDK